MIELTAGERFRVARRRAGLTQAQVASVVGRPQNAVARWEASEDGGPSAVWREAGLMDVGELRVWEEATLLRERIGLTIENARSLFGWSEDGELEARRPDHPSISHVTVLRIEHGTAPRQYAEAYLGVLQALSEPATPCPGRAHLRT